MSAEALEAGSWRAYRDFYRWSSIWRAAMVKEEWLGRARHLVYASAWKKFEPVWDWLIRGQRVFRALPLLEKVLEPRASIREEGTRCARIPGGSEGAPMKAEFDAGCTRSSFRRTSTSNPVTGI